MNWRKWKRKGRSSSLKESGKCNKNGFINFAISVDILFFDVIKHKTPTSTGLPSFFLTLPN